MVWSISAWIRPFVASTLPRLERNGSPAAVVTRPPGLLHDQRAGRDIPRLKFLLPEPIESPCGDVAEIDRRTSKPANGARARDEFSEEPEQLFRILVDAVVETGDEQ